MVSLFQLLLENDNELELVRRLRLPVPLCIVTGTRSFYAINHDYDLPVCEEGGPNMGGVWAGPNRDLE